MPGVVVEGHGGVGLVEGPLGEALDEAARALVVRGPRGLVEDLAAEAVHALGVCGVSPS